MLDQHDHRDLGGLGWPVRREPSVVTREVPGLLRIVTAGVHVAGLRGAGLASHLEPSVANGIGGALRVVHHREQRVVHAREVLGRDLRFLAHARRKVLDDRAIGGLDRAHQLRGIHGATVRQRGVRQGQLQRRHRRCALPDRRVQGEADAELSAVAQRVPGARGDAPCRLRIHADARLLAEAELRRDARDAVHADGLGELEEVDVARLRKRIAHVHLPVHVGAVEDAAAEGEVAVASLALRGIDDLVLERGERAERFERRPGLECAADVLVEHRPQRVGVELVEALTNAIAAGAAREVVGVEVGLAVHREQPAGAHVDDDRRPRRMRAHRALDRLDEIDVHGEPQIATRQWLLTRRRIEQALYLGPGPVAAARVDDTLLPATLPAQVALPRSLDAGGADHVARVVAERIGLLPILGGHRLPAGGAEVRERLGVDLGGVPDGMRAEMLVRVVADWLAHHLHAGHLDGVLLQLGGDVTREILTYQDGTPARRAILGSDARVLDARGEAHALVGVEPQRVRDAVPRVRLLADHDARAHRLRRLRARHHPAGDDEHVERGTARGEHAALRITDDPAGGRDGDATDHVLVRGLRVLGALHDLQLEEARGEDAEREERDQREPAVPLAELADVGAGNQEGAHAFLAVSFVEPDMVARWMRCARRKTSGATAPVARTCGRVSG